MGSSGRIGPLGEGTVEVLVWSLPPTASRCCRTCHRLPGAWDGQPASIHSISSARLQRTAPASLIGRGAFPEETYRHQVRLPTLIKDEAC